jgi:uncharacterized membrane protein SpoIIM required for sporulation
MGLKNKYNLKFINESIDDSKGLLKYKDNTISTKDKKTFGYVKPMSISNQAKKLGKPLNTLPKKPRTKITFKQILYLIITYFKELPTKFANDLPYGLKSLYYGILGCMVGFGFAILLFPENPGIFAILFITVFLTPFIQRQIKYNELMIGRTEQVRKKGVTLVKFGMKSEKFSFKDFFMENKGILKTYFYFFIGVMLVIISLIAVVPQETSSNLFNDQGWEKNLIPSKNLGFENVDKPTLLRSIFTNNLSVLLVAFILALVFPLGAVMIIVWNAIYWGVVFTQYALIYSSMYGVGFLAILVPLLLSVSVHMILEIISYFFAAVSGNILAIGIIKEKHNPDRMMTIIRYCIILLLFALGFLFIGVFTEVYLFDVLKNIFFSIF